MMNKEQSDIVKIVYSHLIESETETWGDIDENLEFVSYLSDSELVRECAIKYELHSIGTIRCKSDHEPIHCMAPLILEAVGAILSLYDDNEYLHPHNAYILSYYIALTELRIIYLV